MERNMDDGGEALLCRICLELAYKPVVPACGHVFCYWCLDKAMDGFDTSYCPVCRSSCHHLPRVCELLHYLLWKAFPKEYKERAEEILQWEREMGTFSPQVGTLDLELDTLDLNGQANKVLGCEKGKSTGTSTSTSTSGSKLKVSDALCAYCKDLIYRPTVFNCGHAFCESCVIYNVSQGTTLKCQVCQSLHPAKSCAVCLELHHFLQSMFTVEYADREKSILVQNNQPKEEFPTDEIAETSYQMETLVHPLIVCDNCGLYPIVGKRYRCKDCSESEGFDLCETCYQSQAGTCIVGRFNQHHKAEHQFEEFIDTNLFSYSYIPR